MATIDELFKKMVERKASDLHLTVGNPPLIRRPDAIRPWQHVLEPLHGYIRLAEKLLT